MANSFITPSVVAGESLLHLREQIVMAGLVHTGYSSEFSGKIGDTVTISSPASYVANDFTTSISIQDMNEGSVQIVINKHKDVSVEVTAKQKRLELSKFAELHVSPISSALAEAVETDLLNEAKNVSNYISGYTGAPSSIADIALIEAKAFEQKMPAGQSNVMLSTTTYAQTIGSVSEMTHADKRADGGAAMNNAEIGNFMGLNFYKSNLVPAKAAAGDFDGTGLANGAVAKGASSISLDGATNGQTFKEGDILDFTNPVGLDTVSVVVLADATVAGGVVTLSIAPAPSAIEDDATVSAVIDRAFNMLFHRNAIALATVNLELPAGKEAGFMVDPESNLSIRVVEDYDISSKKNTWSFDMMYGTKLIDHRLAVRVDG